MANVDSPSGFRIVGALDGSPVSHNIYSKAVGDTKALGFNDLVDILAAGTDIDRQAAGGPFTGVNESFGAASTATNHNVAMLNSRTLMEAQTNTSLVTADTGLNCDVIADVAPNSTTNISAQELDGGTEAATATLDMFLYKLAPYVGNASGTNSRWFVLCNDLRFSDLKVGI